MKLEAIESEQKKVFTRLREFEPFYLAGGTALAMQIGHRISADFDLFYPSTLPKNLLEKIERTFRGQKIKVIVNSGGQLTVLIDGVQVTFLEYPFPVIQDFVNHEGLKMLSVEEIGATKAYVIGRRATFKDYVDLFFILKGGYGTLEKIVTLAEKKYQDRFSKRLFLEQLVYMEDVPPMEIRFLKEHTAKEEIENFFEKEVAKLGRR